MNDLSKLPKWARNEIKRLTADVEYWKSQCRQNITETNTFLDIGLRADDMPLPNNARIRFNLGYGHDEYVSARIDRDGKTLHLMAGSTICILPQVANVIGVRVAER